MVYSGSYGIESKCGKQVNICMDFQQSIMHFHIRKERKLKRTFKMINGVTEVMGYLHH